MKVRIGLQPSAFSLLPSAFAHHHTIASHAHPPRPCQPSLWRERGGRRRPGARRRVARDRFGRLRRAARSVRGRQVDTAEPDRRGRPAHFRVDPHRRRRDVSAVRKRTDAAAAYATRLRLSVLQPDSDAERVREHRLPSLPGEGASRAD